LRIDCAIRNDGVFISSFLTFYFSLYVCICLSPLVDNGISAFSSITNDNQEDVQAVHGSDASRLVNISTLPSPIVVVPSGIGGSNDLFFTPSNPHTGMHINQPVPPPSSSSTSATTFVSQHHNQSIDYDDEGNDVGDEKEPDDIEGVGADYGSDYGSGSGGEVNTTLGEIILPPIHGSSSLENNSTSLTTNQEKPMETETRDALIRITQVKQWNDNDRETMLQILNKTNKISLTVMVRQ
jgi:hypothetical protein